MQSKQHIHVPVYAYDRLQRNERLMARLALDKLPCSINNDSALPIYLLHYKHKVGGVETYLVTM